MSCLQLMCINGVPPIQTGCHIPVDETRACMSQLDYGSLPYSTDTLQSKKKTMAKALPSSDKLHMTRFISKNIFVECFLSCTRQNLCRVLVDIRQSNSSIKSEIRSLSSVFCRAVGKTFAM